MHKLLLALAFVITTGAQASQAKTRGLRYCNMDQEFFDSLPSYKRDYYSIQIHKINRMAFPNNRLLGTPSKLLDQKREALDLYRRANESLLLKNDHMAVHLLKQAALHIDIAKVLLAYCYRYGIGTKCNKTASNILLDLVANDEDDKRDMVLHLEYLLTNVELGL